MTGNMDEKADIVVSSNAVYIGTGDKARPGAIAIAGNRIIAVGSMEEIEGLISPHTQVYSYGDQLIMPGFHDFHLHVLPGSLHYASVNLLQATSEEEAAEMVKAFADTRPDDPWILGFSWYHTFWTNNKLPHRSTLDRLIPDRPVYLLSAEGHAAWVNSKALEMINVTSETADPPYGEIHRDADGEPTGILFETATALAQEAFQLPHARKESLYCGFFEQAVKLGVTSISDFFPVPGYEIGDLDMYREMEAKGQLTTRIHFLVTLDGDLERPRRLREACTSGKLKFSGLKQFLDGVPATYTAFLVDPYSDRPDTRGETLIDPDKVKEWVIEADKEGFRIRLHACGDGAVRLGLDCYESASRINGTRDSRHTIEHIEVIHPDDIGRFAQLGVIASMQPEHMALTQEFVENPYLARLGQEREPYTWPIKTLMDSGAQVGFGSDYPVVHINPMLEIYRAVTRIHNDGQPEEGWNPKERITIAEALQAYTYSPAYGVFREQELGTLEVGKLADLIILDRNLLDVPADMIRDTKVLLTMIDGEIVYQEELQAVDS
ncbi:amidohydrolase [Paenibacillus sp. GCM10027629]|uniref:amidohydrolase n=1 Tax=Paenibacillus sp. GCM10027629 TaxID=3273414 RepID=UPI003637F24E